jgi:hypothetical protein
MPSSAKMQPAAEKDINALLWAAFVTAMQIITEEGQSRPFGVLLDLDGRTLIRHISRPLGVNDDDMTRLLKRAIYQQADSLQAALLVARTGDSIFVPTIRGHGDHRDGTEFAFYINWRLSGGGPPTVVDVYVEPSKGSLFR